VEWLEFLHNAVTDHCVLAIDERRQLQLWTTERIVTNYLRKQQKVSLLPWLSKLHRRLPVRVYNRLMRLVNPSKVNVGKEWQRILNGNVFVGPETHLVGAQLHAHEPAGCFISIGAASNIACTIVLERRSSSIRIGSRTHIGGGTLLDAACSIDIGDDVLIAFEVLMLDHDSHSLLFSERRNDVRDWIIGKKDWTHVKAAPIHIADKAWVGARAIILEGIRIGEGAVVAAGSVVTKDVPAWTVVGGNPARVIRTLTNVERGVA